MTESVEREFRRAKRTGTFARDIDPALLARALTAMVDRHCYLTDVFDPVPIEDLGRRARVRLAATLDLPFAGG